MPPHSLPFRPGDQPVQGYELIHEIGTGGSGRVWRACGPGNVPCALKFVPLAGPASAKEMRALDLTKQLGHPHLIRLFGSWQEVGYLIQAMELDAAQGDILDEQK